ncbi:MAG: TIGR04053 family radical SAM/SPASM domain-containing protein [Chloroflexi bacterium]|nr:TIGR04053 family radical SAM/SPASM domain-containing protein [Chloroflexota bacterium]
MAQIDFDKAPFTVVWEITRACALACLHCRAEAQPKRDPRELTTEEGFRLIDEIKEFGSPIFVLTGGDPMMRRDLPDLIRYSKEKGLRVALAPSATALVTRKSMEMVKEAGIQRVSMSLDGHNAEVHDAFRQTPGSFKRTIGCLNAISEAGLSVQVNSTVSRYNVNYLNELADIVARHGAVQWSVFFLVPAGRGKAEDMISAEQMEEVFNWLYDLSKRSPFDVKSTAAQHYRRVVIQRERAAAEARGEANPQLALAGAGYQFQDGLNRPTRGVNDGNGFCFISHIGEVCPSGFLPLVGGNVRERSLIDIYRNSQLFRDLRDPSKLKGKCGRCEFKVVCGGNRGRSYAVTGDYLAEEPYCVYQPPA